MSIMKIQEYRTQKKVTSPNVERFKSSYLPEPPSSQTKCLLLPVISCQPERPAAPTAVLAKTIQVLKDIFWYS